MMLLRKNPSRELMRKEMISCPVTGRGMRRAAASIRVRKASLPIFRTEQMSMKFQPFIALLTFLFLQLPLHKFPQVLADLNSDRQALLDFAAAVPHARKLNWNATAPVCTSWVGVTCDLNRTRVIAIRLPGIGLSGPIPVNTIGKLDALGVLSLRSNNLSGNLPSDIPSIPSLRRLFLQYNNFSSVFPASLSPRLNALDFSYNSFTGIIPTTLQNLTRLAILNLQNNSISGVIPYLNLPSLKVLNFSYNNLTGSIPNSLKRFPSSSFIGNPFLCGSPLKLCSAVSSSPSPSPSSFPNPPTVSQSRHASSKNKLGAGSIIAIVIGGLAFLFLLLVVVVIHCLKRKDSGGSGMLKKKISGGGKSEKPNDFGSGVQEAEKNKLFFFEGCSYNFDLEDLLKASAEVLGKGSYGTTYKAALEEGTQVVVKRLKELAVGKREFEQQMEVLDRVGRHPNVMPLRAYYYSKDEKLLVYSYMPAGSLFSLLHAPLQPSGHDEVVDLPRWVRSVVREEWTAEVFDVELLRFQHFQEEMVQMLQIALACVAKTTETRPKMDEIVRMIEDIRQPESKNRTSSEAESNIQTP
ncbi:hypothetical protein QUC31_005772 [Theobroma cacao]